MIEINKNLCIQCKACSSICEFRHITIKNGAVGMDGSFKCCDCGHCLAACPVSAISMPEYDMSQVLEYDNHTFDIDPDNFMKFGGRQILPHQLQFSGRQLNGGIAACAIELMANSMGLGALYLGYGEKAVASFDELKEWLGLTPERQLTAILCVGYPDTDWRRTVPRNDIQVRWR